jgi:hypothetical protein
MTEIPFFTAEHDQPHQPGPDPLWQESALFTWYDMTSGVGGFVRLGHEPGPGTLNCCFGVFTADGLRFRANVTGAPLAPGDRGEAHLAWGPHVRIEFDGVTRIRADFEQCGAELHFKDFHPRINYAALAPERRLEGAAHHFEVSGRILGHMRLGDYELAVDALGHRDRSWANRDWSPIRSTRWWPCIFGPDFCTHIIHAFRAPGQLVKLGYVWRDGRVIPVIDSDLLVHLESDALTPRRGEARLWLADGNELAIRCERRDGIVLHVRGYTAVETIGVAHCEGRVGMSNLEVCSNAAGGALPPAFTIGSNGVEGLSRRTESGRPTPWT